jgi:hypothetical protein
MTSLLESIGSPFGICVALGILFNPVSGAQTRKWLSDRVFGPSDEFTYQGGNSSPSSN